MLSGSCLCGEVKFEVTGPLPPLQFCHCADCRKAQGTAFAANVPVATADITWLSGQDQLCIYKSSPGKERVFCPTCGSPILSRRPDTPGVVRLRAGILNPPTNLTPGFHFYTADKADWWEIEGDLVQYPGEKPKDIAE